jgi:hypothetical protein
LVLSVVSLNHGRGQNILTMDTGAHLYIYSSGGITTDRGKSERFGEKCDLVPLSSA